MKNIQRLQSSKDSLELAIDIVAELLNYIPMKPQDQQGGGKGDGDNQPGQPTNSGDSDTNEMGDDENDQMGGGSSDMDVQGEASSEPTDGEATDSKNELSKTAKQQLQKKFQKQKVQDFLQENYFLEEEDFLLDFLEAYLLLDHRPQVQKKNQRVQQR